MIILVVFSSEVYPGFLSSCHLDFLGFLGFLGFLRFLPPSSVSWTKWSKLWVETRPPLLLPPFSTINNFSSRNLRQCSYFRSTSKFLAFIFHFCVFEDFIPLLSVLIAIVWHLCFGSDVTFGSRCLELLNFSTSTRMRSWNVAQSDDRYINL